MTELRFIRDGWIDGDLGADEGATYTRLKVMVGKAVLTRAFSKRGGGETEALNLPLFPLASYIAKLWWPLLYEPLRAQDDRSFLARHRLDLPMHGYIFPALGLCSAGDNALLVDWAVLDNDFSPLKFLTSALKEPVQVTRESIEPELMDIVESVLCRLNSRSAAHQELEANWNRVRESLGNPHQAAYCMAAGRLGIDPYDPEAPDIGKFAESMPEALFNDISEAANVAQLASTAQWTQEVSEALDSYPIVNVEDFGEPPLDDLAISAGEVGFRAAKNLRSRLGFSDSNPRKMVEELLGAADTNASVLAKRGPGSMTGLAHRTNGVARIGTIAASARQRHFRACAATYIAWCSNPGDLRAGTVALTRRQQASRAFAAELVAPVSYLKERAGETGFTEDDIEVEAGTLIAPHDTVLWQAWRAGVPLPDVEPRAPKRNSFFDAGDAI